MTCAACGKEGCHPNYHKSILQIVEECGPEDSTRILTDLLLHVSSASAEDRARLAIDRIAYGVAVEDQEGRRVGPTDSSDDNTAAAGRYELHRRCTVCGGEAILELGRLRPRCMTNPEHYT